MEKMIENIHRDLQSGDEIYIAFQGGEPTLAGDCRGLNILFLS